MKVFYEEDEIRPHHPHSTPRLSYWHAFVPDKNMYCCFMQPFFGISPICVNLSPLWRKCHESAFRYRKMQNEFIRQYREQFPVITTALNGFLGQFNAFGLSWLQDSNNIMIFLSVCSSRSFIFILENRKSCGDGIYYEWLRRQCNL